jgi:ABC-type glycerol-3-phosphate transport system substrate-binding protein
MKSFVSLFLAIGMAAFLAGCGEKSSTASSSSNSTSSGGSLATAPADYLNAAVKAQQSAVKTVDTTSLNQAIQLFNVEKGRNPHDLNELVQERFVPKLPEVPFGTKLVYDADKGKVTVEKQ